MSSFSCAKSWAVIKQLTQPIFVTDPKGLKSLSDGACREASRLLCRHTFLEMCHQLIDHFFWYVGLGCRYLKVVQSDAVGIITVTSDRMYKGEKINL